MYLIDNLVLLDICKELNYIFINGAKEFKVNKKNHYFNMY